MNRYNIFIYILCVLIYKWLNKCNIIQLIYYISDQYWLPMSIVLHLRLEDHRLPTNPQVKKKKITQDIYIVFFNTFLTLDSTLSSFSNYWCRFSYDIRYTKTNIHSYKHIALYFIFANFFSWEVKLDNYSIYVCITIVIQSLKLKLIGKTKIKFKCLKRLCWRVLMHW